MMIVFNSNPRIVYLERAHSIYFFLLKYANTTNMAKIMITVMCIGNLSYDSLIIL